MFCQADNRTLPDDTTTRLDSHLKSEVIEGIKRLAKDKQFPFSLNEPRGQLLASAERRAKKSIRSDFDQ